MGGAYYREGYHGKSILKFDIHIRLLFLGVSLMWVWIATFRCHAGYELGRARDLVEGTHERLDPKGEVMTLFGMQAVRELS